MFCYALIKTIYKSKCTCIKIATFLLGCRLFCFIVVFYLDIKLLKLSLIKVILLQYISHRSTEFLNQAFFSSVLFCCTSLHKRHRPPALAQSDAALRTWTRRAQEVTHQQSYPLVHLFEEVTGWNSQITDKFIFLVKKAIHLAHYYSDCNTALRGPHSYPRLAAQGCHCLQLVWQDRIR